MSHDISRDSFSRNRGKGYARVRRLQGRMFTDADFNEQVDLAERQLRRFIRDLIGYHAGPADKLPDGSGNLGDTGFKVAPVPPDAGPGPGKALTDLTIGGGAYYVDGVWVRNPAAPDKPLTYTRQAPVPKDDKTFQFGANQALLAFLDVFSVPVTPLDDPDLLDRGFGGRDSSDRDRWHWVVRVGVINTQDDQGKPLTKDRQGKPVALADIACVTQAQFATPLLGTGGLAFYLGTPPELEHDDVHCVVLPDPGTYSGPENQLYRVEVHRGGTMPGSQQRPRPWFKWSKDNAAPAFAIRAWAKDAKYTADKPRWLVTLDTLDALGGLRSLEPYHWVEPLRPHWFAHDTPMPLLWVEAVDPDTKQVTLALVTHGDKTDEDFTDAAAAVEQHFDQPAGSKGSPPQTAPRARLVLWDHEGEYADYRGLPVETQVVPAGSSSDQGIELEYGLRALVQNPADGKTTYSYRAGDYWLYAARVTDADESPAAVPSAFPPPDGPEHVYAPLAVISAGGPNATAWTFNDLRRKFGKLWVKA